MVRAVAAACREADLSALDTGARALARRYAHLLDAARDTPTEAAVYGDLGPKLLATLTALGLTPAGRGKKGGAGDVGKPDDPLDELRRRRERRGAS